MPLTPHTGFFMPMMMAEPWLVCSAFEWREHGGCDTPAPWTVAPPGENFLGLPIAVAPVQLHGVALAAFASLIAPFGGFFASAIKRAYGLDDFSDFIPGHGGFMDRLDCQFIMALSVNVHCSAFIHQAKVALSFSAIAAAASQLDAAHKKELYEQLHAQLGMSVT